MLSRRRERKGFTLIELMIVVAIIGILAAIAVPQFSKMREKGYDADAQSALANIKTAQEAFFVDNNGYTATIGDLSEWFTPSTDTNISLALKAVDGVADAGWTITIDHAKSSTQFLYDSTTGQVTTQDKS